MTRPTIKEVVDTFNLPERALESWELKHAISVTKEDGDMDDVAFAFLCEWDCNIVMWFGSFG